VPTLNLSKTQLSALHKALERYLERELKAAAESGRDVTLDDSVQECEAVFEQVHETLAAACVPRGERE